LGDDEIAKMLQDSFTSADVDMKLRALREEQVEAQRILLATQSALDVDGDLLSDAERADLTALIEALQRQAQGDDHDAIKVSIDALARGTEEFAARRMDRSVRAALAGRKLDEIS
jgi:molecular chaperone HscA